MIDPSFNDSFLLGSCLNKINTLKNGSYNERCTGKGLTLFPQVVLVENRSTTRRGMAVPIPRTFNSRLRERILATVWFEDAPPPPARRTPPGGSKPQLDLARKSPKPQLVLPRRSPSSRCPPGCWPLLQLNLGPNGLSPRFGEAGHRPQLAGLGQLVPAPWGFFPTTEAPPTTSSTSARPSNIYLRL